MYMPIIMIGHKTKHRTAACQHTTVPPIRPRMTIANTSKIETMVSDVKPFRSAIFEATIVVMIPGARSSRSNQLIYLYIISSIRLTRKCIVSFSPIIPNKVFSPKCTKDKYMTQHIIKRRMLRASISQSGTGGTASDL